MILTSGAGVKQRGCSACRARTLRSYRQRWVDDVGAGARYVRSGRRNSRHGEANEPGGGAADRVPGCGSTRRLAWSYPSLLRDTGHSDIPVLCEQVGGNGEANEQAIEEPDGRRFGWMLASAGIHRISPATGPPPPPGPGPGSPVDAAPPGPARSAAAPPGPAVPAAPVETASGSPAAPRAAASLAESGS